MACYILTFFFTCFFFWIGQNSNSKWCLWNIMGILTPCFICALRNTDVGTDTATYEYMYDICIESPSWLFASMKLSAEPTFYYLSRLSYYFTGFSTLNFIYQLITVLFLFLTIYKYRDKVPIWLVFLMYFCYEYSSTLNIMRQCAAVSILLYGCTFLISDFKKFIFLAVIGCLFHTSCFIIACMLYTIYLITFKIRNSNSRKIAIFCYIISLIILSILFLKLDCILTIFNFGRMQSYAEGYVVQRNSYFSITEFIYRIIFIVFVYLAYCNGLISKKVLTTFLLLIISELFLMSLGLYNSHIARLAIYLTMIELILIASICQSPKITKQSRILLNTFLSIISLVYWWWTIVHNLSNEVIPYTFA